jgi:hypothetical protein
MMTLTRLNASLRNKPSQLPEPRFCATFSVSDLSIRYVAFVPDFEDFCLCEFVREEKGWIKVIRLLTPTERQAGEEISDDRIILLARNGNMVSAIRLYRAKHQVGLLEGKVGVESLLKHSKR